MPLQFLFLIFHLIQDLFVCFLVLSEAHLLERLEPSQLGELCLQLGFDLGDLGLLLLGQLCFEPLLRLL